MATKQYHMTFNFQDEHFEIDGEYPAYKLSLLDFMHLITSEIAYWHGTGRQSIRPNQTLVTGIMCNGELHLDIMEPTS